uniref:Uncharacterized protein n=1 Tax=Anguilla anguilla TaxID=7936 RepID=A0A0E9PM19_ANGAN
MQLIGFCVCESVVVRCIRAVGLSQLIVYMQQSPDLQMCRFKSAPSIASPPFNLGVLL